MLSDSTVTSAADRQHSIMNTDFEIDCDNLLTVGATANIATTSLLDMDFEWNSQPGNFGHELTQLEPNRGERNDTGSLATSRMTPEQKKAANKKAQERYREKRRKERKQLEDFKLGTMRENAEMKKRLETLAEMRKQLAVLKMQYMQMATTITSLEELMADTSKLL